MCSKGISIDGHYWESKGTPRMPIPPIYSYLLLSKFAGVDCVRHLTDAVLQIEDPVMMIMFANTAWQKNNNHNFFIIMRQTWTRFDS